MRLSANLFTLLLISKTLQKPVSKHVALQLAENKLFFLQQKHFEEGENMGHMLEMLVQIQQA